MLGDVHLKRGVLGEGAFEDLHPVTTWFPSFRMKFELTLSIEAVKIGIRLYLGSWAIF